MAVRPCILEKWSQPAAPRHIVPKLHHCVDPVVDCEATGKSPVQGLWGVGGHELAGVDHTADSAVMTHTRTHIPCK